MRSIIECRTTEILRRCKRECAQRHYKISLAEPHILKFRRPLTEGERLLKHIKHFPTEIDYSDIYSDDTFNYLDVVLDLSVVVI